MYSDHTVIQMTDLTSARCISSSQYRSRVDQNSIRECDGCNILERMLYSYVYAVASYIDSEIIL